MLAAILHELDLQKNYLGGAVLDSIYFGGGTPSLLKTNELEQIFEKIHALHKVSGGAEITLEANPDDLTPDKIFELKNHTVSVISDPAKDRYLNLLKTKPDIVQNVPLKQIATYLGVTDTSLSRIRKEIAAHK